MFKLLPGGVYVPLWVHPCQPFLYKASHVSVSPGPLAPDWPWQLAPGDEEAPPLELTVSTLATTWDPSFPCESIGNGGLGHTMSHIQIQKGRGPDFQAPLTVLIRGADLGGHRTGSCFHTASRMRSRLLKVLNLDPQCSQASARESCSNVFGRETYVTDAEDTAGPLKVSCDSGRVAALL